jgi:hypothetical protein
MKDLKILMAAIPLLLLTGCFAEDYDNCPMNVVLHYRLPDAEAASGCAFLDNISTATTSIYAEDGTLVRNITTTDTEHRQFRGVKLTLMPGTYHVISWGNAGRHTVLPKHKREQEHGYVTYSSIDNGVTGNGDALYYAPGHFSATHDDSCEANRSEEYVMVVDPVTGHEGTLDFHHAHRRIEVFVKGFYAGGSRTPGIRLTGLPTGLTYKGMNIFDNGGLVSAEINSTIVSVTRPGLAGDYALSAFNVFYLKTGDFDIGVQLLDPITRTVEYSTRLNEHIDPAGDDPEKDISIRILIEFMTTGVQVSVPGWSSEDVNYDWNE